jgi:hypothetical protein
MNDFWQENKRLVTIAGCGLCVFFIGLLVIGSLYGSEVTAMDASVNKVRRELQKERYSAANRDEAVAANETLRASLVEQRHEQPVEFLVRTHDARRRTSGSMACSSCPSW